MNQENLIKEFYNKLTELVNSSYNDNKWNYFRRINIMKLEIESELMIKALICYNYNVKIISLFENLKSSEIKKEKSNKKLLDFYDYCINKLINKEEINLNIEYIEEFQHMFYVKLKYLKSMNFISNSKYNELIETFEEIIETYVLVTREFSNYSKN